MLEETIDRGSDENLMPINMLKMLFQRTPILELNKCINKKVILHTYNISSIQQLGICRVTIKHKDIELPCSFFVVPGKGTALLGMLDCKKIK